MSTKQPQWKLVAKLGGVDYLNYGGKFLYRDLTGVYAPELEILQEPSEEEKSYILYRVCLDPCFYTDDVLSDNKFHKDKPAWFADYLQKVADCVGVEKLDLVEDLCSNNPRKRAEGYECLINYFGPFEFDQYPIKLTTKEVKHRYSKKGPRALSRLNGAQ